ncbi:peptidoglycan-binding protein, partial [Patescibacteria group bacterium]|nr:peptidoglycan-binding protein [Patescibacteria group bacterium]
MKTFKKYFIIAVLIFGLSPALFTLAQEVPTVEDLLAIIDDLKEQITQVQDEVDSLKFESETSKVEIEFLRTLNRGVTGDEVEELQEFLKQFPDIYPEGLVTGYFGPLTEKAVKNFQKAQGIVSSGNPSTTGFGQVGPLTRNKLNDLITDGAGASGKTPPGLLTPPGIQDKISTTTATTTPSAK